MTDCSCGGNHTEAIDEEVVETEDVEIAAGLDEPVEVGKEEAVLKDMEATLMKLKEVIKQENVDFIILAGFMRILGSDFVKNFPDKIINIHPSLLPKYPGLNTHKKVLENKDKEHGVTVHLVDEGLDSGPIIGYIKFKVDDKDKENDLINKIHKIEHFIYPEILSELQEGKISVVDNKIKIDDVYCKDGKEYFI